MKKIALLISSGLLAAALAIPVQADEYDRSDMDMRGACKMDMHGMRGDCPMQGTHSMTGTVDKIDHAKGVFTLKHGAADMKLHFPPSAIKDLRNGDTITVNLGYTRGAAK